MTKRTSTILKIWLFCLVFLPITLSLGFWQLDRAEEKRTFLRELEHRASTPISDWVPNAEISKQAHIPFRVIGQYLNRHFLLDNRIKDGKPGYEVLSLFQLLNEDILLINRGWIAAGKYRQTLPEIESPNDLITLEGSFYLPEGEIPILKETPVEIGWPKRIQQVQWNLIEGTAEVGKIVPSEFRLLDSGQPSAYITGWPKTVVMPAKHLGYAYQWFGLAIALILLTLFATIKIIKNQS